MKYFLSGIGLGGAIGLWLAPATGSQTRQKLMARGADVVQRLAKKLGTERNGAEDAGSPKAQEEETGAQTQGSSNNRETSSTLDPVIEVLNSASKTKLQKVPGIGAATARRILENRPFENEADVVESKVMPEPVLKKLKDKLVDADEDVA